MKSLFLKIRLYPEVSLALRISLLFARCSPSFLQDSLYLHEGSRNIVLFPFFLSSPPLLFFFFFPLSFSWKLSCVLCLGCGCISVFLLLKFYYSCCCVIPCLLFINILSWRYFLYFRKNKKSS